MGNNNDFSINIGLKIDDSNLATELKNLQTKINKDSNGTVKLKIDFGNSINESIKSISNMSVQLSNLQKQVNNLGNNNRNAQIINMDSFLNQLNQLNKEVKTIEDVKKELSSLGQVKIISNNVGKDVGSFIAQIKQVNGLLAELRYSASEPATIKGITLSDNSVYQLKEIVKVVDNTDKVLQDSANKEVKNQEKIQQKISETITKREQENKLLQQGQTNAINKTLEDEYKERQKIQEQIANTIKLREQENRVSEQKQAKASNKVLDENYNDIQKFSSQSINQLEKLQEKFKGLYNENDFTKIKNELNNLLPNDSELNSKFQGISNKIKQLKTELTESQRINNLGTNIGSGLNVDSSIGEIQRYLKTISDGKAHFNELSESVDNAGNRIKQIHYMINEGHGLFSGYTLNVDSATNSVYKLNNGIMDMTSHNKSFTDTLKSALESVTGFSLISGAYFAVVGAIKEALVYTSQMDNALVSLNKVVDMSKSQLEGMKESALQMGEALGKSSLEISQAMAEAGRQFKNTDDIKEFTRVDTVAPLYSNI